MLDGNFETCTGWTWVRAVQEHLTRCILEIGLLHLVYGIGLHVVLHFILFSLMKRVLRHLFRPRKSNSVLWEVDWWSVWFQKQHRMDEKAMSVVRMSPVLNFAIAVSIASNACNALPQGGGDNTFTIQEPKHEPKPLSQPEVDMKTWMRSNTM